MIIELVIAAIFIIIAGIGDAAQTSRRDLFLSSPIADWMTTDKLKDWYIGGNSKYNPSFPSIPFLGIWQADFWHTMKFVWIYAYAAAIATIASAFFVGWYAVLAWLVVFIIAQGLEGETFRVFYGNVFRRAPKESIWQILSDINPFKNSHNSD